MKRVFLAVFLSAAISAGVCQAQEEKDREDIFVSLESKKEFAGEITSLLEKAWIKWQKAVVVSNVHVEGSRGLLSPGDMRGPVLTYSSIFSGFDRKGKPREYVECVKVVAKAVGLKSLEDVAELASDVAGSAAERVGLREVPDHRQSLTGVRVLGLEALHVPPTERAAPISHTADK